MRKGAREATPPTRKSPRPSTNDGPGASPRMHAETPYASATPYPPTDSSAVLSAMAGLTAGFGMGPGDPCLHGRARAGRSLARASMAPPGARDPPRHPGGCTALVTHGREAEKVVHEEELGLLVPLG